MSADRVLAFKQAIRPYIGVIPDIDLRAFITHIAQDGHADPYDVTLGLDALVTGNPADLPVPRLVPGTSRTV